MCVVCGVCVCVCVCVCMCVWFVACGGDVTYPGNTAHGFKRTATMIILHGTFRVSWEKPYTWVDPCLLVR